MPVTYKVLCVDDEANILRSLRRLFMTSEVKIQFLAATSAREALHLLVQNMDTAVVISDYNMPENTGIEFLSKAREIAPDAVRIMLSGSPEGSKQMEAARSGLAHMVLAKPWQNEDLVQKTLDAVALHVQKQGGGIQPR